MTLSENGFEKVTELKLGSNGRIDRSFAKDKDLKYIIYAFVIDGDIAYIGQTKDLHKRMDSYANGKYWTNTNPSHVAKSEILEDSVTEGKIVEVWVRHCHKIVITTPSGSNVIANMDADEAKYIEMYDPPLNSKLRKKR